jgi:hypothetical protein
VCVKGRVKKSKKVLQENISHFLFVVLAQKNNKTMKSFLKPGTTKVSNYYFFCLFTKK